MVNRFDFMNNDDSKSAKKILEYIEQHGIVDKDSVLSQKNRTKKVQIRKRAARITIDLHGMNSFEAQHKIRSSFMACRCKGIKEILIVHGRGFHSDPNEGPVLKNLVKDMLEHELKSEIHGFRTALARDGGEGATLVSLR